MNQNRTRMAMKDISLKISVGEALGIMGSPDTPLETKEKILAAISEPSLAAYAKSLMKKAADTRIPETPEEDHCDAPIEHTIKFRLPEHRDELYTAMYGGKAFRVLEEAFKDLRSSLKYQSPFHGMDMLDDKGQLDTSKDTALEAVREYLAASMRDHGIHMPGEDL
jgi:hypothetical protein